MMMACRMSSSVPVPHLLGKIAGLKIFLWSLMELTRLKTGVEDVGEPGGQAVPISGLRDPHAFAPLCERTCPGVKDIALSDMSSSDGPDGRR